MEDPDMDEEMAVAAPVTVRCPVRRRSLARSSACRTCGGRGIIIPPRIDGMQPMPGVCARCEGSGRASEPRWRPASVVAPDDEAGAGRGRVTTRDLGTQGTPGAMKTEEEAMRGKAKVDELDVAIGLACAAVVLVLRMIRTDLGAMARGAEPSMGLDVYYRLVRRLVMGSWMQACGSFITVVVSSVSGAVVADS